MQPGHFKPSCPPAHIPDAEPHTSPAQPLTAVHNDADPRNRWIRSSLPPQSLTVGYPVHNNASQASLPAQSLTAAHPVYDPHTPFLPAQSLTASRPVYSSAGAQASMQEDRSPAGSRERTSPNRESRSRSRERTSPSRERDSPCRERIPRGQERTCPSDESFYRSPLNRVYWWEIRSQDGTESEEAALCRWSAESDGLEWDRRLRVKTLIRILTHVQTHGQLSFSSTDSHLHISADLLTRLNVSPHTFLRDSGLFIIEQSAGRDARVTVSLKDSYKEAIQIIRDRDRAEICSKRHGAR